MQPFASIAFRPAHWARALVLACIAAGAGACGTQSSSTSACGEVVVNDEGRQHVPYGTTVTYVNNPPASGPHWPCWAPYQPSPTVVPDEQWVHNLEHGAVVLLFRCADETSCPDAYNALVQLDNALPDAPTGGHRVLVTAFPPLPKAFAAVAWDHVLLMDPLDAAAVQCFASAYEGHGPEDIATGGSCP